MEIKKVFSNLGSSEHLLEFYRKKISEHEKVEDELNLLLSKYKYLATPSQQENEYCDLTNELMEIREALSDVNIFIHSERQHSTQLYLERERLKVDLEVAEKKLNLVLSLTNITNEQINIFIQNPKKKQLLKHSIPPRLRKVGDPEEKKANEECPPTERELALEKHLDLVEQHLKDSQNAWMEEKASFLEERELQQKEAKAQALRDQSHSKLLSVRLDESQKLLQEVTQSLMDAKKEMLSSKRTWLAEKDKLMNDIAKLERKPNLSPQDSDGISSDVPETLDFCDGRHIKRELISVQRQLRQEEELRCSLESRCKNLEREMCKLREERDAQQLLFKERMKKLSEKKDFLIKQNQKSEQLRRTQADGFMSDLKLMKEELRKIVQQFCKLTSSYCQNEELPNALHVKELKAASTLARSVHHAIIQSKNRLLKLEEDVQ